MTKMMKTFLKQLEAWVTDLRHQYGSNIFFRTTLLVILIEAFLALVLIGTFVLSLEYANREVAKTVVTHVASILENETPLTPETLNQSISALQTSTTLLVLLGVIVFVVVSGFLLSYVTLRPTRESLQNQKLFISNVAHELRTPLSTIKTSTEVLLLDEHLPQNTKKILHEVVEELDRASEIINNLLSLNQLLRPERIEFQNVDFGEVVHTSVDRLHRLAKGKDVEIILKKTDRMIVWGNASALEQVATNLIRNSITYIARNRHGVVRVSIEPDQQERIVFSVADNGIGIARQDLFRIFEPFYRADTSRTRTASTSKGSGLGLAIVNEIIRIHHGQIRMQSVLGKGTTVTVILPAGKGGAKFQDGEARDMNEVSIDFSKQKKDTSYFDESPQREG